ncbi:LapA family protein [Mangrovimonas sp. YM274]|uniref:LapA family protein n=1 Tax=Mangrovimonas sp. YM274 TaxID=3070660 RepID=UPI0027DDE84C|nr:LapA family protein [Mangrovimonas sp. YM274]WMI67180.1 LapA family protein [Mangrovimonas sp. YM274]
MKTLAYISHFLVSTTQLTVILILTAAVFIFFIVVAILKMYKLKAENKRLTEMESFKSSVDESYKDFTEGHLYDNK